MNGGGELPRGGVTAALLFSVSPVGHSSLPRGVHADGLQGERERALQALLGQDLQEDGQPHRQQLLSSMYVQYAPSPAAAGSPRRALLTVLCPSVCLFLKGVHPGEL